jgi:hypothetical protein
MPTATIKMLKCIQAATGTDLGGNALSRILPPALIPGVDPLAAIGNAVGNAIGAIDAARSDPDDLYVTVGTASGRDNAVWPGRGSNATIRSGQSQPVNISLPFSSYNLNVSLWDYDSGSGDDLLGSVTILAAEQGQGDQVRLAASQVEGSAYYVVYSVD